MKKKKTLLHVLLSQWPEDVAPMASRGSCVTSIPETEGVLDSWQTTQLAPGDLGKLCSHQCVSFLHLWCLLITPTSSWVWLSCRFRLESDPLLYSLSQAGFRKGRGTRDQIAKQWSQEKKGITKDEMVGWHTDSMDMSLSKLWEF